MGWNFKSDMSERSVAECDVKICELCGTLNSKDNTECFTCGWKGAFCLDPKTVHLAWQRLYSQYEDVRIEHVTNVRLFVVGELGAVQSQTGWKSLRRKLNSWWAGIMARRDERAAVRASMYNPQHTPHTN